MLGKVFAVLTLTGVGYGVACGRLSEVSAGALDGAARAVEVTLALMGVLCLWNGMLAVFREAGLTARLARLLAPLLRVLFPQSVKNGAGESIAAALSANLLGLGNAATPLALAAMEGMQAANPTPEIATDDMVTFTVLSTASVNLFPGTLLALRVSAGSADPFAVLVPIWIASIAGAMVAVLFSKLLCRFRLKRKGRVCGEAV